MEGEEGEDTFEEQSGSPSLQARMMELQSQADAEKSKRGGSQLSPDRASHDGVEVHRPSTTPTSRYTSLALG